MIIENTLPMRRGFKRKTIIDNIQHKMNAWIKTLPEDMRDSVHDNYVVTGGAIASMLLGELPNDYDIYFKDANVAKKVADHYLYTLAGSESGVDNERIGVIESRVNTDSVEIVIKSAGILGDDIESSEYQYFESTPPGAIENYFKDWAFRKAQRDQDKETYAPAYITSNALTLHDGIQIILRFCGNPETIHKNFDYLHCTNWYTRRDGLVLKPEALECILSRELKYVGSLFPVCSIFRMRKFIKRGWTITAGEMFKMAYDTSLLNLNDKDVLQEQLIGVDAAYFNEILGVIADHKGDLDRTYLFEIVNRIFDDGSET